MPAPVAPARLAMTGQVRLEGFHAVKHALRFGAQPTRLVTPDLAAVEELRRTLAPDLDLDAAGLVEVDITEWGRLAPRGLPSPVLGAAARPNWLLADAVSGVGPIVALEQPRHLGNLGAVVRVAAAAGAAGVVVIGDADPFHPTVVRAAAGLHWAVPVVSAALGEVVAAARVAGRRLVALHGEGRPLRPGDVPDDALLLAGTERHGLSGAALAAVDERLRIPMRAGVSSLNLATAAAVALYVGAAGPA